MTGLLLALALAGAEQAPVQQTPTPQVNHIRRGPRDVRELINAFFPREIWEALWHEDYAALDKSVENGWLVDVPNDPEGLGIQFQLDGDFPIAQAEEDELLKPKLFRLAKSAAGCLLGLAEYLRTEEAKYARNEKFSPLATTSLVRSWEYQLLLTADNPNADIEAQGVPPTHVFGLAFDLTRLPMTRLRERLLRSRLNQLQAEGKIIFFTEGAKQSTYHVTVLLQARVQFEADYERLIKLAAPTLAAAGQQ